MWVLQIPLDSLLFLLGLARRSVVAPVAEHPSLGVLIGVVHITGLVATRQLAAFTENAELLPQLDDRQRLLRSLVRQASGITIISR